MFKIFLKTDKAMNDVTETMIKYGWFHSENVYKKSKNRKVLITFSWENHSLVGTFAQSLNFKEYEFIHHALIDLIDNLHATYDDSHCCLGYLEDGSQTFIVTNWAAWEKFLTTAKLKSLEGKKVSVQDENENVLLEGLLVDYETDPFNDIFTIISCSVITLFGERKTTGSNLKIEAVYE
ncbi:hypothetical protein ACWE42_22830 [Sutcliffiella cohnii]|uniref:Uncharacterized protein n=1 Tax=Sutcliffiella cohnii TaxID=33932 RepID=A0A223KLM6_9BACI|nr:MULTISPECIES: hypothetical protein [Sutcliffiella]AST90385.1 hypothetical protein BC6307_03415 [Sutcliffiella cohnii]WBL16039.1 hypothetical protein O1A01_05235 [Sutcliffiella sp. NC1]